MQFVLLIYQGTTPTPKSEEWKTFSDEEKRTIYTEYEALNKTHGLTPGLPLGLPQDATTVRVQNGKTLTTKGPFVDVWGCRRRILRPRGRKRRSCDQGGCACPGGSSWRRDRDTPGREVLVAHHGLRINGRRSSGNASR